MTRKRIVKQTYYKNIILEYGFRIITETQYVVEEWDKSLKLWAVARYLSGLNGPVREAIFETLEEAEAFACGKFGYMESEVVWERRPKEEESVR